MMSHMGHTTRQTGDFRRLLTKTTPGFETDKLALAVTEDLLKVAHCSNVSREQLAARVGVSTRTVNKMLNGEKDLTLRHVATLAHVLGVRITISVEAL